MMSVTLLNQRHARTFCGRCSYKGNSSKKCVDVCTYSTTPLFPQKGHPLRCYRYSIDGFPSARKISTCRFPLLLLLLNLCLPLNTDTISPKLKKASLRLVTYVFRKEKCNKIKLLPSHFWGEQIAVRVNSQSPKQLKGSVFSDFFFAIFDSKIKINW